MESILRYDGCRSGSPAVVGRPSRIVGGQPAPAGRADKKDSSNSGGYRGPAEGEEGEEDAEEEDGQEDDRDAAADAAAVGDRRLARAERRVAVEHDQLCFAEPCGFL